MCVWINRNRELQSFSLKCKFGVFLQLQGRSAALGTSRCGALLACARETLALIRLKKQTSSLLWVHFLCGGRRCSLERGDCHNLIRTRNQARVSCNATMAPTARTLELGNCLRAGGAGEPHRRSTPTPLVESTAASCVALKEPRNSFDVC